jgi:hypothetical protein
VPGACLIIVSLSGESHARTQICFHPFALYWRLNDGFNPVSNTAAVSALRPVSSVMRHNSTYICMRQGVLCVRGYSPPQRPKEIKCRKRSQVLPDRLPHAYHAQHQIDVSGFLHRRILPQTLTAPASGCAPVSASAGHRNSYGLLRRTILDGASQQAVYLFLRSPAFHCLFGVVIGA